MDESTPLSRGARALILWASVGLLVMSLALRLVMLVGSGLRHPPSTRAGVAFAVAIAALSASTVVAYRAL